MIRILRFFRASLLPYLRWFVAGTLCLLVTNWLSVQVPLVLGAAIDALRQPSAQTSVILGRAIWLIGLMGLGIILVRTLSRLFFFTPARLIEATIKNDLFAHMTRLPTTFFATIKSGDIVSRLSNDLTFVRVMAGFGLLQLLNVTAAILLTGWQMFRLSAWLTFLVLIPIGLSLVVVSWGIHRFLLLTRESQERLADLSDHILASLQGVQTIQGFQAEDAFSSRFQQKNEAYRQIDLTLAKLRTWILPLVGLAGALAIWLLFVIGGPLVLQKKLSVGELVAFSTYIAYLLNPLRSMGWMISVFQRGVTSLERLDEISHAPTEGMLQGPVQDASKKGGPGFRFDGLTFAYPDQPDKPILHDISIEIPRGSMVGIFGRTGAGKSTLLYLLSRLHTPTPGQIFVDGVDLTALDIYAWRKRLSVAPQIPFLFSETIEENITLGKPDPARLEEVLRLASLSRDLAALPEGIKTLVGERGIMLSGGQRQRVALARAFYRPFDLLLLDDVLSAVDHSTEQALIRSIEAMAHQQTSDAGRPTVFFVSHRLSALSHADLVLVLEQGRLVDHGTPAELRNREGLYRDASLQETTQASVSSGAFDASEPSETSDTSEPSDALDPSVSNQAPQKGTDA